MFQTLQSLLRNERGNVAMIVAVALVPITGAAGVALDYSRASNDRTAIQTAADSAAIAGLRSIKTDNASRVDRSKQVFNSQVKNVEVTKIDVDASANKVIVTASANVPTTLMNVLGVKSVPVSVKAVAVKQYDGPPPCVFALAKSGTGINISGSSEFTGVNCTLQANSSSDGAIDVDGSAKVKADGYCAVGTVTSKSPLSPEPEPYCDEMSDPYANLAAPTIGSCDYNSYKVSPGKKSADVLQKGVYCKGLDIQGDAKLQPGLYIIKDGPLNITASGTVTGDGVTFYLTGTGATFKINGGSSLSLKASQDAPYAGMLIVQDKAAAAGSTSTINGNSSTVLMGAIYAPTQDLKLTGDGTFGQASPFMPMIANTVTISGNNSTYVDATKTALVAPLPKSSSGARLSE